MALTAFSIALASSSFLNRLKISRSALTIVMKAATYENASNDSHLRELCADSSISNDPPKSSC